MIRPAGGEPQDAPVIPKKATAYFDRVDLIAILALTAVAFATLHAQWQAGTLPGPGEQSLPAQRYGFPLSRE